MAEGARFELADPLRGLRFSRPARSAAPSPLHGLIHTQCQCLVSPGQVSPVLEVAPGLRIHAHRLLTQPCPLVGHQAGGHDADGLLGEEMRIDVQRDADTTMTKVAVGCILLGSRMIG